MVGLKLQTNKVTLQSSDQSKSRHSHNNERGFLIPNFQFLIKIKRVPILLRACVLQSNAFAHHSERLDNQQIGSKTWRVLA